MTAKEKPRETTPEPVDAGKVVVIDEAPRDKPASAKKGG